MMSEATSYRLSDVIEIIGGGTPKKKVSEYWSGDIPWLSVVDFNSDERFVDNTAEKITELGLQESSTKLLEAGQVIISARGTVGCLAQLTVPMAFNQSCYGLSGKSGVLDNDYLYYLMRVKVAELQQKTHGAVFDTITRETFNHIEVKIPALSTQKVIAKVLGSFDYKIKLNHQINQTLEQMAQAIFKSWFVDFEPVKAKVAALEAGGSEDDALLAAMQAIAGNALFASDAADADAATQLARLQAEHPEQYATLRATAELFPSAMQESDLGEIPEGWEASTLSDFCEFQNGYAFKGKDWADSGFPVVKIGSVKPGFVDLTKVSYVSSETVAGLERFELKAGDILVGMTGYPGETGLVPNYADRVFLNQRVGRFIPNEKYLYAYIFSAVRGSEFKVFVESQAHGSAQANISGKAILQYPLISGSKNLMMRFYEVVNPQIQQMICLNAESSQLGELRDTLLPKLLSGELSVSAAADQITKAEETIDV
ncbi:MAG: restriction endonuclease subunit S [Desulfuromonadaceae bacterium]|nr:restriction endonuclease subunit S [Desulfuromonadaceae bacterium]